MIIKVSLGIYWKGERFTSHGKSLLEKEIFKEIDSLEYFISITDSESLQRMAGNRIKKLTEKIKCKY